MGKIINYHPIILIFKDIVFLNTIFKKPTTRKMKIIGKPLNDQIKKNKKPWGEGPQLIMISYNNEINVKNRSYIHENTLVHGVHSGTPTVHKQGQPSHYYNASFFNAAFS